MQTLAEIRERVRDRADIEFETVRYPDAELNDYINHSYKELYGLLIRKLLIRPEVVQTIVADGSLYYTVDAAHYSTLAVYNAYNEDYPIRITRHKVTDRPFGIQHYVTGEAVSYRIAEIDGDKAIEFFPRPDSGSYYVSYVPLPGDLTEEDDAVDDVLAWIEYVVVDVAIKILRKERSDSRDLQGDKAVLMMRIEDEAEQAEAGEALTVRRTNQRVNIWTADSLDYRWSRYRR